MGGSSPSSGGSSTVTQVQQIPAFQQQMIQNNEATAQSLASQDYPVYQAPIVAGVNPQEQHALDSVGANAYDWTGFQGNAAADANAAGAINPIASDPTQNGLYGAGAVSSANPYASTAAGINSALNQGAAANVTGQAENSANSIIHNASQANPFPADSTAVNNYQNATSAGQANNPGVIASYMNPYIQQSLAPQLMQAQLNLTNQQNTLNQGATSANAFGDSRQATQSALANYYGQQSLAGIEAQGLNTGFNNAATLAQNQQQMYQTQANTANNLANVGIGEQNAQNALAGNQVNVGNLGVSQQNASTSAANAGLGLGQLGATEQGVMQNQQTLGLNEQKILQAQQAQDNSNAAQQAALGQQNQNQNLAADNALYNAGNIKQQNDQAALNAAYQQWENSINWKYQNLNVMESAVNSSPYQMANATTLPTANTAQQGLNAFTSLAGGLGSLASKSPTTGTGGV